MITILKLFGRYIGYHERALNIFDKRKRATVQAYYAKYRTLQDYLSETGQIDLKAEEIKIGFAKSYFEWLTKKGFSHNYNLRVVLVIKSVLNYGVMNEIIKYNYLHALKIPKLPPKEPVYLTIEEIKRLLEYSPINPAHQKVKSMFLFQCFTGMDYTDAISVRKHNIIEYKGKTYIKKPRNKTGEEYCVPYLDEAKIIFEKHNHNMHLLANATYNEVLKEVAYMCKINKHLTTHVGRKTFAMTMLNSNGIDLVPLSKMLGHAKYSTTEMYYTQRTMEVVHNAMVDYDSRQRA